VHGGAVVGCGWRKLVSIGHICHGCRKMLAAATPTIILDVWTNSMAANFTPSVFWDSVFASGALNSVGPRQAKWTGTFLNATTYLVRLYPAGVQTRSLTEL
jgi:hypothetical protein